MLLPCLLDLLSLIQTYIVGYQLIHLIVHLSRQFSPDEPSIDAHHEEKE